MKSILIIEDDIIFSRTIGNWLVKQGMRVESVTKLSDAKKSIREKEYDLILADLRLPDGNSTLFLEWLNDENYTIPFLIMTNYGQVENAVQAMQLGAVNYLCKPIRPDKLSEAISNVLSKSREENEFYRGESPQALELYKKLKLVALSDYSILIRGASGVGKEHVAREIHDQSHRHSKPYITVDCGAIPEELAASEFFGHRKGAYTGAESDTPGLFRAADGGTLFLDEIGNLSYKTQTLLLRALQEKTYKPLGSTHEYAFNVRFIAATNENLEKAIKEGRFREDLFYRLNEFTLTLPRLSECKEDILPMANFFLRRASEKLKRHFQGFDHLAETALEQYPWFGNIRELKNTINRAALIAERQWITVKDLSLDLSIEPEEEPEDATEQEKEKVILLQTLERTGNNRSKAAKMLKLSRTTFYEKLRKYHII
ncbi:sigma-54-dependent transcriptional regulator [Bacteroides ovatus]|uniref:sigma-54-dependent transcriptional regulator n=1 Tax=Bacteroides ovatus TaxID=28116 RepID=UPI00202DD1A0|nr:sigma-54 dependent transcriptional regulator [Bacteroides ovatus]MCM1721562.1 sigma-54 dependent transcriptional regulator [Bacteroides ovatus]MCM1755418.1 sigma-54 dependent transcriptional regulator [Bacteroides ovatus]MCM1866857.1 sigma-54 dependent transcriptional regulator [Bacteroides ovatus]MCM1911162.1 sigma-54 dependent transcriptional regulator [Bacteroides ovatus]